MRSVEPPDAFEVAAQISKTNAIRRSLDDFVSDVDGMGDLEALEDALREFNLFEALGVINAEIRHSNFLGWLFNPQGSHGLGDLIVKRFLQRAIIEQGAGATLTAVDIDLMDLSDLEVRREWSNIDILLVSQENRFAVVIENKILARESAGQLERYKNAVTSTFKSKGITAPWRYMFLFLTLEGGDASDGSEFRAVTHRVIVQLLSALIANRGAALQPDVCAVIRHYIQMMRRHHMEDSDLIGLAKKLYKKHRPALDFIFENRPDHWSETRDRVVLELKNLPLTMDICTPTFVRFYPSAWKAYDQWLLTGTGWKPGGSDRLILCEIRPDSKRECARFQVVLAPGGEVIRNRLLEKLRELGPRKPKISPSWTMLVTKSWQKLEIDEQASPEDSAKKLLADVQLFLADEALQIEDAFKSAFL